VELLKFRDKGQIPRLGSKFCRPRKTVGPIYETYWNTDDSFDL